MPRYLRVRYDVTGLSDDEVGYLTGEAVVQAEASDGHPSVTAAATLDGECTGYLDDAGHLAHDGDTCPVHEGDGPTIVRLSGADCIGVTLRSSSIEVRQYHADHLDAPAAGDQHDEHGRYQVVEVASGTAPVTAGPSPGPVVAQHRGVRAWATVEDYPDDPDRFVTVRYFLDPTPPGLDQEVYSRNAVKVPEEHRRG